MDSLKFRTTAKGQLETLVTEEQAIAVLGLTDRPSPKGAIRWLMRTGKLSYIKVAKGVNAFAPDDLREFIDTRRIKARPCHGGDGICLSG